MMSDPDCLPKIPYRSGYASFLVAACFLTACYSSLSGRHDGGEDVTVEDVGGEGDGYGDVEVDAEIAPDGACVNVSGDFGDCEMMLGYGFDGRVCRPFSGCGCAPYCGYFFNDLVECVSVCVQEGHCNVELFYGRALASDPFGIGDHCDEINACPSASAVPSLLELFPESLCGEGEQFCSPSISCRLFGFGVVTESVWQELCGATLIDGVGEVECIVWGP